MQDNTGVLAGIKHLGVDVAPVADAVSDALDARDRLAGTRFACQSGVHYLPTREVSYTQDACGEAVAL